MVYVVLNGGSDLPFPRTLQSLPLLMIPSLTLYQDLSAIEQGTGGKKVGTQFFLGHWEP